MTPQYLTRQAASDYCTAKGCPVARTTLQKLACLGKGPQYFLFGSRALYTPEDLDSWIASKLSPSAPRASTAEVTS